MKILWLTSWYPNRTELFAGDFIQRHAQAVSLFDDVYVIHIVRDGKGVITKNILVEENSKDRLQERIIYYYSHKIFFFLWIDKLISQFTYRRLFKKSIKEYIALYDKPDLVHFHVGMKAGTMAKWIKQKMKIPYVVTEHWTGFLPEARPSFKSLPYYWRKTWLELFRNASAITAVSGYLAEQITKLIQNKTAVTVIPNVVNTKIFFPAKENKQAQVRFIHVSGLDYQKNPEAILKAFAIVKKQNPLFSLAIFGSAKQELIVLANELGLEENVRFHGEVIQPVLAKYMQASDCLILYSRYETFGCVVIEANAVGIPVIVSDIPVMHEIVEEEKNGFIIKNDDPAVLADKLIGFMNNYRQLDFAGIAEVSESKYGYAKVGKQFSEWYSTIINSISKERT